MHGSAVRSCTACVSTYRSTYLVACACMSWQGHERLALAVYGAWLATLSLDVWGRPHGACFTRWAAEHAAPLACSVLQRVRQVAAAASSWAAAALRTLARWAGWTVGWLIGARTRWSEWAGGGGRVLAWGAPHSPCPPVLQAKGHTASTCYGPL
jgi:hypothetical protein